MKSRTHSYVMPEAHQQICTKLYPEIIDKRGAHKISPEYGRDITPPPIEAYTMDYGDPRALQIFGRMKRGKGTGPFTDTTNLIIDTAMALCSWSKKRKYSSEVNCFL